MDGASSNLSEGVQAVDLRFLLWIVVGQTEVPTVSELSARTLRQLNHEKTAWSGCADPIGERLLRF